MQKISQKLRHIRWLRNIRSQRMVVGQPGQPARKRIRHCIPVQEGKSYCIMCTSVGLIQQVVQSTACAPTAAFWVQKSADYSFKITYHISVISEINIYYSFTSIQCEKLQKMQTFFSL